MVTKLCLETLSAHCPTIPTPVPGSVKVVRSVLCINKYLLPSPWVLCSLHIVPSSSLMNSQLWTLLSSRIVFESPRVLDKRKLDRLNFFR